MPGINPNTPNQKLPKEERDKGRNPETPKEGGSGNTKDTPTRNWCFTFNNYTEKDIDVFLAWISDPNGRNKYLFQEETGENGTPHLQGVFKWENKITFKALKKVFQTWHVERCMNWSAMINYCRKPDTRTGQVWQNMGLRIERHGVLSNLRKWQRFAIEICTDPKYVEDRWVWWFYDKVGGAGKTALCKHIMRTIPSVAYVSGKASDIAYYLSKQSRLPRIIIWDVPRSSFGYINYSALEKVKDGILFSPKYESKMLMWDVNPTVIVFANEKPDYEELSAGRWQVRNCWSAEFNED